MPAPAFQSNCLGVNLSAHPVSSTGLETRITSNRHAEPTLAKSLGGTADKRGVSDRQHFDRAVE